ncbi:MAG: alpha/beta hydrolase, partial [Verrucomicrobiota bacterium]
TVPYLTAVAFDKKLKVLKVDSTLKSYEGAKHGFFNKDPYFTETLNDLDEFLVGLGWLSAQ